MDRMIIAIMAATLVAWIVGENLTRGLDLWKRAIIIVIFLVAAYFAGPVLVR